MPGNGNEGFASLPEYSHDAGRRARDHSVMTAVVEAEGLTKYYGERRGLEDLTLDIRPGEVFGYLGPNGAGKPDIGL